MTANVINEPIRINVKLWEQDSIATSGDDTHYIYTDPNHIVNIHVPESATAAFSVAVTTDPRKNDGEAFDIEDVNVRWNVLKSSSTSAYIGSSTKGITGVRIISDQNTNAVPWVVSQVADY